MGKRKTLTQAQYQAIAVLLEIGCTDKEIARQLKLSPAVISRTRLHGERTPIQALNAHTIQVLLPLLQSQLSFTDIAQAVGLTQTQLSIYARSLGYCGYRSVINVERQIVYASTRLAGAAIGVDKDSIQKAIATRRRSGNYHWAYHDRISIHESPKQLPMLDNPYHPDSAEGKAVARIEAAKHEPVEWITVRTPDDPVDFTKLHAYLARKGITDLSYEEWLKTQNTRPTDVV